jgi:hypothetical protein
MNSHRTTISIPRELREQMDAVDDQVNWSAVAAAAFREKLFAIRSRTGWKMKKSDVINRLRGMKNKESECDYEDGKAAGRNWAEAVASLAELRRLEYYVASHKRDGLEWWNQAPEGSSPPLGAPGMLAIAISPRPEVSDFWENALATYADRSNDSAFLHGFGDGALELWQDVKHEL